jgi:hypothetical protein
MLSRSGGTGLFFAALGVLFVPSGVSALSLPQALGLFHVVVGLLLTATLLLFTTAFCAYLFRFNTWPSNRDETIRAMEWAVAMLFTLILLITIVNLFQNHSAIVLPILAFALVIVAIIVAVRVASKPKEPAAKKPSAPH